MGDEAGSIWPGDVPPAPGLPDTILDDDITKYWTGGVCLAACLIVLVQILLHLYHYTQPQFQRYILRILFMVPSYALTSWFSLVDPWYSIYLDTTRDLYESWVVYNFLSLCLAYVGGPGNVINRMEGREVKPSWLAMTCCLPAMPIDGSYIRMCKIGALQFVYLKPVLAALTLLMSWAGAYGDNELRPDRGYLWIVIVYNVSYTMALYSLLLFYIGAHDLLTPFKPLLKFILVKSVIFLTFWQSLVCSFLVSSGYLSKPEDGRALQNVLICGEMIFAAVCMLFAFPSSDYAKLKGPGVGKSSLFSNVGHAVSLNDVVSDTVHQFAPTYQEYVLHSDGGVPRVIRTRTFIPIGRETTLHRTKSGKSPVLGSHARGAGGSAGSSSTPAGGAVAEDGESDAAGLYANAGFENSYGNGGIDMEDDVPGDEIEFPSPATAAEEVEEGGAGSVSGGMPMLQPLERDGKVGFDGTKENVMAPPLPMSQFSGRWGEGVGGGVGRSFGSISTSGGESVGGSIKAVVKLPPPPSRPIEPLPAPALAATPAPTLRGPIPTAMAGPAPPTAEFGEFKEAALPEFGHFDEQEDVRATPPDPIPVVPTEPGQQEEPCESSDAGAVTAAPHSNSFGRDEDVVATTVVSAAGSSREDDSVAKRIDFQSESPEGGMARMEEGGGGPAGDGDTAGEDQQGGGPGQPETQTAAAPFSAKNPFRESVNDDGDEML